MLYGLLADAIVAIHFAYVAFVVLGQLVIVVGAVARWQWVRNFWFRLAHLAAIGVVVMETVGQVPCPLTIWERDLRLAAGQQLSDATFVGRLLHDVMFFDDVPAEDFAPVYYTFGAIVLATFVLAPPRWPRRAARSPSTTENIAQTDLAT
jgi:hypothetical protein